MRVLTVGNLYPPAAAGGYERVWRAAVRALRERGHGVRVLTTTPVPGAEPRGEEEPEVFRELRWYWRNYEFPRLSARERLALERHNARVLRRHLADFQPDVVSWWGMGGMSLSLIEQVRRTGLPAIGVVGDPWMVYGFERDAWIRAWRRRPRLARLIGPLVEVPTQVDLGAAARWLFQSRFVRSVAGSSLPDAAVVYGGVDRAAFPERPPGPWEWRLLCMGRVEPVKGVATAIEALAALPTAATLRVVGTADQRHRADLEALAARLAVRKRVAFEQAHEGAIGEVYAEADAVLFPVTWDEPFGLVPLEAMSVGRPVVATGTGGSAEYLRDGENCLLFPRGDATALADRVRRLATDEALRARLRARGRETAARLTQARFEAALVTEVEAACARGGDSRGKVA